MCFNFFFFEKDFLKNLMRDEHKFMFSQSCMVETFEVDNFVLITER